MAAYTYDGSTIVDMATGRGVPAGTSIELRATPDGSAVTVYDLVSNTPMSLVASPASSYPSFGADIDEGWLVAGDGPPTHVLSNELERPPFSEFVAAAESAADVATAAQAVATQAATAAADAREAAEAAAEAAAVPADAVVDAAIDRAVTDGRVVAPEDLGNVELLLSRMVLQVTYADGWPGARPVHTGPVWAMGGPTAPTWLLPGDAWFEDDPSEVTPEFLAENTYSGLTAGAAITAAQTGSGTPWDVVNVPTGGAIVQFAGNAYAPATTSGHYSTGTTSGSVWSAWRGAIGHRTKVTLGFGMRLPVLPAANMIVGRIRSFDDVATYTSVVLLRVTPAGRLQMQGVSSALLWETADGVISAGTDYYLEIEVDQVLGVGRFRYTPEGGSTTTVGDLTTPKAVGTDLYEYGVGLLSNSTSYHGYFSTARVAASGSVKP